METDVNEVDEIATIQRQFGFVDVVDGHCQSIVHRHRVLGRTVALRLFHRQHGEVQRTPSHLHATIAGDHSNSTKGGIARIVQSYFPDGANVWFLRLTLRTASLSVHPL